MSPFKHLLCSIVNKILAHGYLKVFVSILFKFKKHPNISGIWVVILNKLLDRTKH